jgi:hypothetical protein
MKRMQNIRDIFKNNRKVVIWLSLFIAAILWAYGRETAPRALLAISFFYVISVYSFMVIPLAVGYLGIKKMKRYLMMAIILPLSIAAIYQIVYGQGILRIWYSGDFSRQYFLNIALLPGFFFIAGLLLRMFLDRD